MLIVNDDHLRLAGVLNLEERCKYCGSALAAYLLLFFRIQFFCSSEEKEGRLPRGQRSWREVASLGGVLLP